ncbi:MAG: pyrimidine 5'-nucleotidase [Proteobacteria bacterium]|nr:pyrimidine 5'-nucleotidase [Methylibium sp.]MBY0365472.1 pyrimidine 5'-nucleotidase [Burkholderiaceae bacterium]MCH8856537.1 pyrimidine 5'-nucleotidase [Pseudomonadota bacterium]
MTPRDRVWLFDLDDTLHNASHRAFRELNASMTAYIETHLGLTTDEAVDLRHRYWIRYGATLTGLQRHHGIKPAHFLHETHRLPGLEAHLHGHAHDLAALRRLPGRKFLMTNAPRAYAERVLAAIGLSAAFEGLICIEDMACFGHSRPKPDARMFRIVLARLGLRPERCVLVEDTLVHQKTAHQLGMATVWMQRWLRRAGAARLHRRPVYVSRRVGSLAALARAPHF